MADVLLLNACDMVENHRAEQKIKSSSYVGFIESNLKAVPFVGTSIVVFEAEIEAEGIGETKVRFGVRVRDLEGKYIPPEEILAKNKWKTGVFDAIKKRSYDPSVN